MQLSIWEIMTLGVLALMIFGPDRLPEVARNAGRMVTKVKREATAAMDEIKRSADLNDLDDIANEYRTHRDDLKRAVALTGPLASEARPERVGSGAQRAHAGPAPFDPDAT